MAVTIGPNFNVIIRTPAGMPIQLDNPPLAFDYSHNDNRGAQAFMWKRVLSVADRLIDLLKTEPYDATPGLNLWDRSMIYVATDFGRTRPRAGSGEVFGTGHDMNNGFLVLSPLAKGNTVLGGVDHDTTYTYGWDTETGVADSTKKLSNERDIYSGVLHALSVDTTGSGLPDCLAFRKA